MCSIGGSTHGAGGGGGASRGAAGGVRPAAAPVRAAAAHARARGGGGGGPRLRGALVRPRPRPCAQSACKGARSRENTARRGEAPASEQPDFDHLSSLYVRSVSVPCCPCGPFVLSREQRPQLARVRLGRNIVVEASVAPLRILGWLWRPVRAILAAPGAIVLAIGSHRMTAAGGARPYAGQGGQASLQHCATS